MGSADEAVARWEAAAQRLQWRRPWTPAYDDASAAWFVGGELNLAENAVDRHLDDRGDRPAYHWEGEPGDRRTVTYRELDHDVRTAEATLRAVGVGLGDVVAVYAGVVPETVAVILACARIGAVHAALPSVLPAEALSDRLVDLAPTVLVTQDGAWRHGVMLPLKARADEALTAVTSVEHTVVIRRTGADVPWYEGDTWYGTAGGVDAVDAPTAMPSDAPLLITYLANRRGRPTGVVHGAGSLATYCHALHVDGLVGAGDAVLWAPMELGWLALETHGIFGPLLAGGTTVLYEGMLDVPHHGRAWEVIDRYGVTALVATPSVVRALRQWLDAPPPRDRLSSLRRIVTAGEPIDEDTAAWLRDDVGHGRATVADGWGLTELGGIVTVDRPPEGSAGLPDPGLAVVDRRGSEVEPGHAGDLVVRHPWPGKALHIHGGEPLPGDAAGVPGAFVTGDRACRRPDGTIELLGRRDHVFSVSGQLVSVAEVRQVLEEHPQVERAEVVDRPDRRTGRAVVAAVQVTSEALPGEALANELAEHVRDTLGGLAAPRTVAFVEAFPADLSRARIATALRRLCSDVEPIVHLQLSDLRAQAGFRS